jgi:sugar phosphate isomerase/epimerase
VNIPYTFAYSLFVYRKYDLHDALEHAQKIGFTAVEIQADRPHLYPKDYDERKIRLLKEKIKELDMTIANVNAFTLCAIKDFQHPSWIEKDQVLRKQRIDHTIESIKIAHKLGCKNISTQPGGPLEGMNREEALQLFIEGIKEVIPYAKEYNVKILVEPEPDLLIENSEQFLEFIRQIDSEWVELNCDLGHFECVQEDPAEMIYKLKDYIGHVHIEDIKDTIHNHKICGHGDMNFKEILKALKDIYYKGYVTIELYPYMDTPDDAGQKSLEFLEQTLKEIE